MNVLLCTYLCTSSNIFVFYFNLTPHPLSGLLPAKGVKVACDGVPQSCVRPHKGAHEWESTPWLPYPAPPWTYLDQLFHLFEFDRVGDKVS